MIALCVTNLNARTGETPTILAFGDSITSRSDSYRSVLVPALTAKQLAFEFIGPNKDKISAHAGYGGKNTKYLLSISKDVYSKYPADIVMFHSGHNSFSEDKPVQGIVRDTINDKVHPNPSGAKKMAAKWLDALLPLLEKNDAKKARKATDKPEQ